MLSTPTSERMNCSSVGIWSAGRTSKLKATTGPQQTDTWLGEIISVSLQRTRQTASGTGTAHCLVPSELPGLWCLVPWDRRSFHVFLDECALRQGPEFKSQLTITCDYNDSASLSEVQTKLEMWAKCSLLSSISSFSYIYLDGTATVGRCQELPALTVRIRQVQNQSQNQTCWGAPNWPPPI